MVVQDGSTDGRGRRQCKGLIWWHKTTVGFIGGRKWHKTVV